MLKQNTQLKFVSLNTNQATTETTNSLITSLKWNLQNLNIGNKNKIALIRANGGVDTNLYFTFCPTIRQGDYSSINSTPLIYSGIGNNNGNITAKNYYTISGNNFNELELKNYVATPQNDFTYPELDGLKPNLWCKFDTGAITTNDGTDAITLTNNASVANAGVSVVGNNSASFNGTTQFLEGTIEGLPNNSFSFSVWVYNRTDTSTANAFYISFGSVSTGYTMLSLGMALNKYFIFDVASSSSSATFANDLNNWVHLVFIFNNDTLERSVYRNGVKLTMTSPYANQSMNMNTNFKIARLARTGTPLSWFNGNMDDLRIYKGVVLSEDQINQLYNGRRLDYPIIKNEAYLTANPIANDPNIHTIPNLWCQFETGALTVNSGTDAITLTNSGSTPNANVSVRGNNSVSFTPVNNQYITGIMNNFNKTFSVSFWIYNRGNGVFFSIGLNNIYMSIDTNYYTFIFPSNTVSYTTIAYPNDINNWVHLSYTYNNTNFKREIYRNGIKQSINSEILSSEPSITSTMPITIGALGGIGVLYNGNMDDLRVYTGKVLTQEEITRIYTGARTDYTINVLPNSTNDLNINTKPNIWCKFDTAALTTNDGTDGTSLTNNGTATNANISMRGNNSVSLNGTNQTITGTINGIAGNSFSISMWLYSKTLTLYKNYVLSLGNVPANFQDLFMGYSISYNAGYSFGFYGDDSHSTEYFTNDLNNWAHLVFVFDKNNMKRYIYRNGVKMNLTNENVVNLPNPNTTFTVGAFNSFTGMVYYNGNVDDLRIYTGKVLTVDEINRIYLNSKADYTTISEPLIGQDLSPFIWYKFDDSTNLGLDSMGKANAVQDGAFAIPTIDTVAYVRGGKSLNLAQSQTLKATYNFSDIVNEITICFWIRITGYGSHGSYDIIMSGAQPRFYIARNAGSSNIDVSIFGSVYQYNTHFNGLFTNDKIWRHFTIIAQKTLSGSVKITSYVNGVFNATATSGTWDTSGISTFNISFSSLTMIGNLDDMRFYNRVLSQAQITELYQNNTFYKLPTAETKYIGSSASTGITYNFELENEDEKIISHY